MNWLFNEPCIYVMKENGVACSCFFGTFISTFQNLQKHTTKYDGLPGLGATLASRIFKSNAILREVQKEVERIFQGHMKLSFEIIFVQVLCITGLQPGGRQYRDLFCRIILIIIINYQMIILTCDGYEYDFPHHDIHYSYAQKHEIQCRCQAPFRQI